MSLRTSSQISVGVQAPVSTQSDSIRLRNDSVGNGDVLPVFPQFFGRLIFSPLWTFSVDPNEFRFDPYSRRPFQFWTIFGPDFVVQQRSPLWELSNVHFCTSGYWLNNPLTVLFNQRFTISDWCIHFGWIFFGIPYFQHFASSLYQKAFNKNQFETRIFAWNGKITLKFNR